MFRSMHGYGYGRTGTGIAKFLAFLCPLLLLGLLLARVLAGAPLPVSPREAGNVILYLWTGLMVLLVFSGAIALILLLIGPWRSRLAGVWLGVVAGAVYLLTEPLYAWAAHFSQYLR